jgi:hypothetical protein
MSQEASWSETCTPATNLSSESIGVRLVYRVEDDALVVMVMAVDRREDRVVYSDTARIAVRLLS